MTITFDNRIIKIINSKYPNGKLLLIIQDNDIYEELTINTDILIMTNEFVVNSNVDKKLIQKLHTDGYIVKTNRYAITGYSICQVVKMTDKFLQALEQDKKNKLTKIKKEIIMTSKEIREKINITETNRNILKGFESYIGELDFSKNPIGYFCYPKGSKMFADDALNQIPARTITELCMFLYGVYAHDSIINNHMKKEGK